MEEQEKWVWVECCCTDADDAIRLIYWPDAEYGDEFFFDWKLCKHPGRFGGFPRLESWKVFKSYIRNIWWAICGRDNTFMTQWTGEPKQAKKLADFINEHYREQKI